MPRTRRSKPRFLLSLQGRSESTVAGNEPQLTVNLLTGQDEHFVYAGTFTLSEDEFDEFVHVLRRGLGNRLDVAIGPVERRDRSRTPAVRRRQNGRRVA
jgi:hypothetical protein